ncbi:MAG: alpha-L-fucosidase [Phycisphaerae bacterium]|nr:alpha-L-fucosidase [Phycisphaerae bacterium]
MLKKSKFIIIVMVIMFIVQNVSLAQSEQKKVQELKDLRFGMFICWSFSTFSGYEWSPGVEDVSFFNPTGFDPDQWCRVAKDAGMGYILFLTKHHDGFCLWNTSTTDRKVSNTKALKGIDVLAEVKKACDKHGLKLALYFSEGDWSWSGRKDIHTSVARPETKKAQLKELLTNYGPIEYIWFDHAVGTGGLSHAETAEFVKSIQPDCFVGYNHGPQDGSDIRLGERGKPAPLDVADAETIGSAQRASFMKGYTGHKLAEFTYPILEGQKRLTMRGAQWFYSLPENDNFAASAEKIYKDYLGAVKYGNIFSLDVGPDRSGKLRKIDVKTLKKVGQYIRGEIQLPPEPLEVKQVTASSIWDDSYKAEFAIDGDSNTRWGAKEGSRSGWLEFDLGEKQNIQRIVISEAGYNRIQQYQMQVKVGDQWHTFLEGDTIGNMDKSFGSVKGQFFRLNIIKASEVPTISIFNIFSEKFVQEVDTLSLTTEIIPAASKLALASHNAQPYILTDSDWFIWGGSVIEENGKYHMFTERWPRKYGFYCWLTHAEIAHYIADVPQGPYHYVSTVLKGRGKGHWDQIASYNPMICKFNNKYYLYYVSTTHPTIDAKGLIETAKVGYSHPNWMPIRNAQRSGVAIADSIDGPWHCSDKPIVQPSGPITKLTVNPAVCQGPDDKYYMIIKGDKPGSRKRNQAVAIAENPAGPFIVQPKPAIKDIDTEDASMWYDTNQKRFYAVFHAHTFIGMITSTDGLNWQKANQYELKSKEVLFDDGSILKPDRMERPFVYTDKTGKPLFLFFSVKKANDTMNICVEIQ